MTTAATLVLIADTGNLKIGERALDSMAAKGAQTEARVTAAMGKMEAGFNRSTVAAQKTAEKVQIATGHTANLAANFNDIAVMMAAGQSPIQLALQQGTQITQVFASLGGGVGALKAVGAAVGSMINPLSLATIGVIALGGAASNWLTGAGAEAKTLEDNFGDLEKQIKALNQANSEAGMSAQNMMAAYGNASPQIRAVLTEMAGIERLKLHDTFNQVTQSLDELIQRSSYARTAVGESQDFLGLGSIGIVSKQLGADFAQMRVQLEGAADMGERLQAAMNIRDFMRENIGAQSEMNSSQKEYYNGILGIITRLTMAGAATKEMARYQADATAHIDAWRKAQDAAVRAADDLTGRFDRQAALQQAVAQYGADSAQAEAMKRDEALRAAQALAEQHGISGPLADQLVRSAMAAYDAAAGADQAAVSLRNAEAAARALASAIAAAAGFTLNLDNQIAVISARIDAQKAGADAAIAGQVKSLELQAAAQRDNALAAGEMGHIAEWRYQQDMQRIGQLGELTAQEKALNEATTKTTRSRGGGARASGAVSKATAAAAKESAKLASNLDREAERWRDLLDPMARYKRDVAQLAQLTGVLSKGEMAEAQKRLNVELADSLPLAGEFVDTMTEGLLNGFSGTLSSLTGMFKKWLAEMIATAWKNRIVVGMGVSGGGVAGAAAGAVPGVPGIGGAGGVLGSVMGGASAFAGGLWGGASSVIGGLTSGGLAGGISAIGSALGGVTSGIAGLGTAIGAIALPVAAVAAVFSFFRKKVKELDSGIRVTVDGMDALVETFRKTETKRFWGLSKKTRTSYDEADQETQDAISKVVGTLQKGVMDAAKVLGFGSATFRDFAHEMKVSTKGMSEEDALKAVQEAIAGLGDDFAGMVPGLSRMRKDGEGASDALLRLSQSLVTVNGIMDTLGHRFRAAGLSGADAASKIAEAFGGLDAMASATQRFYEAFYSDAERLATTTRQTNKAMRELGIVMPKTRNEYRAIISALDLTTDKGRKTYAALIGMADAFDLILPQIGSFTKQMEKLQGRVVTALDTVIDRLGDAVKWNASAAADWRKAGTSIREYLDKLRGTASALFNPLQARAANQALYNRTLGQAMRGNVEAAGNLPGAAQNYLGSVQDTARTREEAALAQARVAAALGKVAVKTDSTAAALERVAQLQQKQLDLLTAARDYIAAGNTMTKEGITKLLGQLGGLDERIKLRAKDAGTIVAGFNDSIKGTKVQADLTGAEGLRGEMGTLRGALVDLRAAIAAETKRQREAVKKVNEAVSKPAKPTTPAKPAPAKPAAPKAYTLADYKLVGGYGLGGSEGSGYAYTVRGPLGGLRTFTDPMGGTNWQDFIKGSKFPAFATGGRHAGGLRIVGEKGPELEATGPSRIFSNSQTRDLLGNREMLTELKAMRTEMAELRAHARRTADSTVQTEKTLKRVDALGVKIDPDQNLVAGIASPGTGSGGGVGTDYVAIFEAAQNG